MKRLGTVSAVPSPPSLSSPSSSSPSSSSSRTPHQWIQITLQICGNKKIKRLVIVVGMIILFILVKSWSRIPFSEVPVLGSLLGLVHKPGFDGSGKSYSTYRASVDTFLSRRKFILLEQNAWRHHLHHVPTYNTTNLNIIPKSRGVVLAGPSKSVPRIIMAVLLLRETGCTLPVVYSYLKQEVTDVDLSVIRSFNITPLEFSDRIKDNDWGAEEFRLGAAKVDAILATPFEEVLFLDPDNFVVRDPTYLFETSVFKRYGALFWPDFKIRKNESELSMWELMGMKGRYFKELEFESGQIVLNKEKVWVALQMARYLSIQARYYFTQFLGDKEAFFWGFSATRTPYFLNPTYIHSVGRIVNDTHRDGDHTIDLKKSGSRFCGQSMLQSDFWDDVKDPWGLRAQEHWSPRPVFMHWNMAKYTYNKDIDYFQSAATYRMSTEDILNGKTFADYEGVDFLDHGGDFVHCLHLPNVKGLEIEIWDWAKANPGDWAARFHECYRIAHQSVLSAYYNLFKSNITQHYTYSISQNDMQNPPASNTKIQEQGSKGAVFVICGGGTILRDVFVAVLFLKKTGFGLPIALMYCEDYVPRHEVEILKEQNITTIDITASVKSRKGSTQQLKGVIATVLSLSAIPYEEILFIDSTCLFLSNPESLFKRKQFRETGAMFWSDIGGGNISRELETVFGDRESDGNIEGQRREELAVRSGVMVLSKKRARKAIAYAGFIIHHAEYFSKLFGGLNNPFYWGFVASKSNYYINSKVPQLLGALVSPDNVENEAVDRSNKPLTSAFCGQALLQLDVIDDISDLKQSGPLFLDMSLVSKKVWEDIDVLRTLTTIASYQFPLNQSSTAATFADLEFVNVNGGMGQFKHCVKLRDAPNTSISILNWNNGDLNRRLHQIKRQLPVLDVIYRIRRNELKIPRYRSKSWFSVLRGIVIPVNANMLGNVVRTMLMIRKVGCKLPILLTYRDGKLTPDQITGLATFHKVDVTLLNLSPSFQRNFKPHDSKSEHKELSDENMDMAYRLLSVIEAPFDEVLLIDTEGRDVLLTRDPAVLFEMPQFVEKIEESNDSSGISTNNGSGVIFWPGFDVRDVKSPIYDKLKEQPAFTEKEGEEEEDAEEERYPQLVVDKGQILVNKKRCWKALHMAMHFLKEDDYYSKHFEGGIDALYWAALATKTHFHTIASHPKPIGIVIDKTHPYGGISVTEAMTEMQRTHSSSSASSSPPSSTFANPGGDARFCGLAIAHFGYEGVGKRMRSFEDVEKIEGSKDRFMRSIQRKEKMASAAVFIKLAFVPDDYLMAEEFDFLDTMMWYEGEEENPISEYGSAVLLFENVVPQHRFCISLKHVDGLPFSFSAIKYPELLRKYWDIADRVRINTRKNRN